MRLFRIAIFATIACVLGCKDADPLTGTQRGWVNEIESLSHSLSGSDPALSSSDLAPFDYLADAKIVGLGEGSHGAHEFFQMKHRIFQYLVEKHAFRAFGFEMDFAEAMIFDDYIQGKTNVSLKSLITTKMLFWTWRTQEVLDLFEWMRTYNSNKAESEKIHLYGVDCQVPNYHSDFLTKKIATVDQVFANDIASKLIKYNALNVSGDSSNYKTLLKDIADINSTIAANKDLYLSKGMALTEYELSKQLARVIAQTHDVIYRLKISDYKKLYRDAYMAENAQWVSGFVGGTQQICVWAHNEHIRADTNRMGYYLASALQNQYKRVGQSFSTGAFHAYTVYSIKSSPIESSTNFLLHQVSKKNFVLNTSNISGTSSLTPYINQWHGLLNTYATYDGVPEDNYVDTKLRVAYDMLVYFDNITPSNLFR